MLCCCWLCIYVMLQKMTQSGFCCSGSQRYACCARSAAADHTSKSSLQADGPSLATAAMVIQVMHAVHAGLLLTTKMHVMLQKEGPRVAFRDHDGLAALLAVELKADLLILLTDVAGLFDGPPSDPDSNFIPTYCPEVHDELIKFGDPSSGGRGGMVSKVGPVGLYHLSCLSAAFRHLPCSIDMQVRLSQSLCILSLFFQTQTAHRQVYCLLPLCTCKTP